MSEALLKLHVNPRSSRNEITGWRDDVLCLKITAPPVEGAANEAVLKYLAQVLEIRRNKIELVSGQRGREKTVRISDISILEVTRRLPTKPDDSSAD